MAGKKAKTRLICSSLPSFCFQMPKAIEEIIQCIPAGKWKGHISGKTRRERLSLRIKAIAEVGKREDY